MHMLSLVTDNTTLRWRKGSSLENNRRNYFMINIHESMGSPMAAANSLYTGWFFMLLLPSPDFFQDSLFFKTLSGCQKIWIKIRSDILSVLIWTQTVCKIYQQKSPLARKEFRTKEDHGTTIDSINADEASEWTIYFNCLDPTGNRK